MLLLNVFLKIIMSLKTFSTIANLLMQETQVNEQEHAQIIQNLA